MYVPGVLLDAVIAPVEVLIDNPLGELLKVPPVLPVRLTACVPSKFLQNGEPV